MMKKHLLRGSILGLGLLFLSCSKETVNRNSQDSEIEGSIEAQVMGYANTPFEETNQVSAYADAMKQVLILAEDTEFRRTVFEEALLQKSGDYDLYIASLKETLKKQEKFKKGTENLKTVSERISMQTNLKPIIFFPRAETLERKAKTTKTPTSSEDLDEPIAVFKNVYDENYDSPGYVLDENNNLVFSRMVNEEYAWENDVYVIGSEENIANKPALPKIPDPDPGSGGGNPPPPPPNQYRTEGRAEYGGKIQVTDRNAIEHWTAGKFEFRVIVISASGTVLKNKQFDQRARSNFKDKKWYDFNEFYFNWNQSNIDPFTLEKWIEVDNPIIPSDNMEVTITVPPAFEGGPTTTIQITKQESDDDLGQSIVQFSDKIGIAYGISHMNFKRK